MEVRQKRVLGVGKVDLFQSRVLISMKTGGDGNSVGSGGSVVAGGARYNVSAADGVEEGKECASGGAVERMEETS